MTKSWRRAGGRYKKKPPHLVGAACTFLDQVCLLSSHRCHPNRKLILNNKDRNKDDNKGEIKHGWIHGLLISSDYMQKRKSVKGQMQDMMKPNNFINPKTPKIYKTVC